MPAHSWEHGFYLPRDDFVHDVDQWFRLLGIARTTALLVSCSDGARSTAACTMLRDAGFQRVAPILGGMRGWANEDLPVTVEDDGEDGLVGSWV